VKANSSRVPTSPFISADGVVHLSVEFWQVLERYSFLIAHDIFVSSQRRDTGSPLLYRPYEHGKLLEAMQPFSIHVTADAIAELQSRFPCSDARCQQDFTLARVGTMSFLLGHEFAHFFYGDKLQSRAPDVQQEIRADRKALEFLRLLVAQLPNYNPDDLQKAFYAAPLVVLLYGREHPDNELVDGFIDQRIEAIIADVPKDRQFDAKDITGRYSPLSTTISMLRVDSESAPDLLSIDGARVPPNTVGKTIPVTPGRHAILARRGDSFAYDRPSCGYSKDEICIAKLQFQPLRPSPAIRPPEPDSDAPLSEWFAILLSHSDRALRPREQRLAWQQWQALAHLDLGSFIQLDPAVPLARTLAGLIERARAETRPLSSWRFDPESEPWTALPDRSGVERCAVLSSPPSQANDEKAEDCLDQVDLSRVWHTTEPARGVDFEVRYRNTCARPIRCVVTEQSGERGRWSGIGPIEFRVNKQTSFECRLNPDEERWIISNLPWDRKPDTMPSMKDSVVCRFDVGSAEKK